MSIKVKKDDAFKRVISKTILNGKCLEFTGNRTSGGYGQIKYEGNASAKQVHRLMYEMLVGAIPRGLYVLHKCDNPPCWNPRHLFLGTHNDNMKDKALKNRAYRTDGNKSGNCKISKEQVDLIRSDKRRLIDIAAEYGIAKSTVSMIKNFKTRKIA